MMLVQLGGVLIKGLHALGNQTEIHDGSITSEGCMPLAMVNKLY